MRLKPMKNDHKQNIPDQEKQLVFEDMYPAIFNL